MVVSCSILEKGGRKRRKNAITKCRNAKERNCSRFFQSWAQTKKKFYSTLLLVKFLARGLQFFLSFFLSYLLSFCLSFCLSFSLSLSFSFFLSFFSFFLLLHFVSLHPPSSIFMSFWNYLNVPRGFYNTAKNLLFRIFYNDQSRGEKKEEREK